MIEIILAKLSLFIQKRKYFCIFASRKEKDPQ